MLMSMVFGDDVPDYKPVARLPELEELQLEGMPFRLFPSKDDSPAFDALTALDVAHATDVSLGASLPRLQQLDLH